MGTSFDLIKVLVGLVDQFTSDQNRTEVALEDFLIWANSKVFSDYASHVNMPDDEQVNMELTFLLIMQNRHFKSYAKKALGDSALSSPDSFSFLYHLSLTDSYRKMQLIKMHMMEAPSGIEVLKRLLKKNLIEEFDDPDDKRAKRIRITEPGKEEIKARLPVMQQVFKQMTAEMTLSEKLHFIAALRDINEFHVGQVKDFEL